jgi:probable rRNA maturation factor
VIGLNFFEKGYVLRKTRNKNVKVEIVSFIRAPVSFKLIERTCLFLFSKMKRNQLLKAALTRKGSAVLSVALVGVKRGQSLNLHYRKRNYPTDVLSFQTLTPAREGLGEIVLCIPVLKKQAKQHNVSFEDEIIYLLIHGFLHLLGYDHEKNLAEERKMMRLQDRIFGELRTN